VRKSFRGKRKIFLDYEDSDTDNGNESDSTTRSSESNTTSDNSTDVNKENLPLTTEEIAQQNEVIAPLNVSATSHDGNESGIEEDNVTYPPPENYEGKSDK
jgi:hypothetical protein